MPCKLPEGGPSVAAIALLEEFLISRGLAHPAQLLLEMHRPLVGVGHALWCVAAPVVSVFVQSPLIQAIELVLSDSTVYEELQRRLSDHLAAPLPGLQPSPLPKEPIHGA